MILQINYMSYIAPLIFLIYYFTFACTLSGSLRFVRSRKSVAFNSFWLDAVLRLWPLFCYKENERKRVSNWNENFRRISWGLLLCVDYFFACYLLNVWSGARRVLVVGWPRLFLVLFHVINRRCRGNAKLSTRPAQYSSLSSVSPSSRPFEVITNKAGCGI